MGIGDISEYQSGKAGGHLLIFTALMKCLVRHFRAQVWSEVISEPDTDAGPIKAQLSVTLSVRLSDWNRETSLYESVMIISERMIFFFEKLNMTSFVKFLAILAARI